MDEDLCLRQVHMVLWVYNIREDINTGYRIREGRGYDLGLLERVGDATRGYD